MRSRILAAFLCSTGAAVAVPPADLVLRNGDILTQDPSHPHAQALAVRHGVIVALDEAAAALVGPNTKVIELQGRAVVPALTDAHAHLVNLGLARNQVELRGCTSAADCAGRIARDRHFRRGAWTLGRGWDQNLFPGAAFPTHAALDKLRGPVWVRRVDGHAGWANAAALRLAGVTRETADPPGGKILRDADGAPTGVLVDNAMALVGRAVPAPSGAEIADAILRGQELALAEGLTEVHEMGIPLEYTHVYARLARSGKLRLRVYAFGAQDQAARLFAHPPAAAAPGAFFTLRGIKLYADGALGSRGAALLEPYRDDPGNRGLVITGEPALEKLSREALASGWQVAVHAIGDGGNRSALDAFEKAGATPERRFRIEHAQVVALEDFPRFARLGVIASMQPTHAVSDGPWASSRLGPERVKGAYAWRRMLDSSARLAFGSDFPVEEVSAVDGFRAAVERTGWSDGQNLTLEETLRAFTVGAAFAAFEEGWRGRVAEGMAADLTVFDRPAADLVHARVETTVVGGKIAWQRH